MCLEELFADMVNCAQLHWYESGELVRSFASSLQASG